MYQIYQINAMSTKVVDDSEEDLPIIVPIAPPGGSANDPVYDDSVQDQEPQPDPFKDFSFDIPEGSASVPDEPTQAPDLKGKGKEKAPASSKGRKRTRAETPMDIEV